MNTVYCWEFTPCFVWCVITAAVSVPHPQQPGPGLQRHRDTQVCETHQLQGERHAQPGLHGHLLCVLWIKHDVNSSLCVIVLIIYRIRLRFKVHHRSNTVKRADGACGRIWSDKISLMIVEEFSFSLVFILYTNKNNEVRKEIITKFIMH